MRSQRTLLSLWLALAGAGPAAVAQSETKPASGQGQPEVTVRDQAPVFKARVNLVLVPVVVRDGQGRAAGNLGKEDFDLFDAGKRQIISAFSVETSGGRAGAQAAASTAPAPPGGKSLPAPALPKRFVAYVFDDRHSEFGDLTWVRDGVHRTLATLDPADRVAIIATSGLTALDFTDDRAKLEATLLKLRPDAFSKAVYPSCPPMTCFKGYRIENRDAVVKQIAIAELLACDPVLAGRSPYTALDRNSLEVRVDQAAGRAVTTCEYETRLSLRVLKDLVRRMSLLPGRRSIILLSPGFFVTNALRQDQGELIDRATRAQVTIGALNASGLWVDSIGEMDPGRRALINSERMANSDVLAVLAEGTGGICVENTNDLSGGLSRIATPPEYLYVLGFSPRDLEPDGSFHRLTVRLNRKEKLTVQARRGYYASKQLTDPAEAAKRELEDAVFAPEDIHDPAVEVHTEFFKSGAATAELAVLTRLDLERVQLHKAGGVNANDLTIVSCLFDRNGNFVEGKQKLVQLRLRDETLARRLSTGLTVKTSFETPPGTYAVRVAVRDARGQLLSAESAVAEIP